MKTKELKNLRQAAERRNLRKEQEFLNSSQWFSDRYYQFNENRKFARSEIIWCALCCLITGFGAIIFSAIKHSGVGIILGAGIIAFGALSQYFYAIDSGLTHKSAIRFARKLRHENNFRQMEIKERMKWDDIKFPDDPNAWPMLDDDDDDRVKSSTNPDSVMASIAQKINFERELIFNKDARIYDEELDLEIIDLDVIYAALDAS